MNINEICIIVWAIGIVLAIYPSIKIVKTDWIDDEILEPYIFIILYCLSS